MSPVTYAGPPVKIRNYQTHWAAVQIQRVYRGFACRDNLWSFNGIITSSKVLRIQRLWRGYRGRKVALELYQCLLARAATRIKVAFLVFMARRQLRRLRAERLFSAIESFQRLWRTFIAEKRYQIALAKYKYLMCRRVQALMRGRLGRRRFKGILLRCREMEMNLLRVVREDVQKRAYRGRTAYPDDIDTSGMDEWALLDYVLLRLLAIDRPFVALNTINMLLLRFPHFLPGLLLLQTTLLYLWPSVGKAKLIREELLDDAASIAVGKHSMFAGVLMEPYNERIHPPRKQLFPAPAYLANTSISRRVPAEVLPIIRQDLFPFSKIQGKQMLPYHRSTFPSPRLLSTPSGLSEYCLGAGSLPHRLMEADPVSLFPSMLDEFQLVYFATALKTFKRNTRTMSLLGCWLGASCWYRCLPIEPAPAPGQRHSQAKPSPSHSHSHLAHQDLQAMKAHTMMSGARSNAGRTEKLATLRRLEVCECMWLRSPQLLLAQAVTFKDTVKDKLAAPSSKDVSQPTSSTASTIKGDLISTGKRKNGVFAEVRVYRVGEMIIVCATLTTAAAVQERARAKATNSRLKSSSKDKHAVPVQLAPMVLLPKEVERVYELSVPALSKALSLSEDKVLRKGKWGCLSEYLLQNVRLVSRCSSRPFLVDQASAFCSSREYKLALAPIEFIRAERNSNAIDEYSARLLQRAYRGSHARFLYRRLTVRLIQRNNQQIRTEQIRAALAAERAYRKRLMTTIQAVIRGWLCRSMVSLWHRSVLRIQTAYRRFSAKLFVIAERRRRLLGPDVMEVLRRGVRVSNIAITLVIKRCGNNYLLQGFDLLQNMKYEGLVLQQEVEELVSTHNQRIVQSTALPGSRPHSRVPPKSGPGPVSQTKTELVVYEKKKRTTIDPSTALLQVMRLTDYSLVAELLASRVALTSTISSTTAELGAGKRDHQACLIILPTCSGAGIEHINSLQRVLADQQLVIDRYHKMMGGRSAPRDGDPKLKKATTKI